MWTTDLQPLNNVSVVFRSGRAGVPPGGVLSGQSPVEDALLNDIIRLYKQVVDLTVEIHRDSNSSALSWKKKEMYICS